MGKTKLIDLAVVNVERKLEKVGALRNTTTIGNWHTVKQNIEERKWQDAESGLAELQDSLQRINLLKSLTKPCAKLRQAFATPDTLVEEPEVVVKETETPRKDRLQIEQLTSELQTAKNDTAAFTSYLQTVRISIEKEGKFPENVAAPKLNNDDLRICLKAVKTAGEIFKKTSREMEAMKTHIEQLETKNKEMGGSTSEKVGQIKSLTQTVEALEKMNEVRKAEKIETFKEQMKLKSLERQVELKEAELAKHRAEKQDLQESLNKISSSQSAELAELGNPYPPQKLAERYREIYQQEWVAAYNKQTTILELDEKSTIGRLLQILQEVFIFCKERSDWQLTSLMSQLMLPGNTPGSPESTVSSSRQTLDECARKQLANIRKQTCKLSLEFVKNAYITQLEEANEAVYTFQEITECLPYIEACIDTCWYMLMQTPPIYPRFEPTLSPGTLFNKEKYDYYSHKGSKIECVVWPPLFYANRKVLLTKGVAIAELYR